MVTKLFPKTPDAIFPVERGRMRNKWFPSNKAEYMTAIRFQELGLTREDVGERDTTFGTGLSEADEFDIPEETVASAPAIEIQGIAVSTHSKYTEPLLYRYNCSIYDLTNLIPKI